MASNSLQIAKNIVNYLFSQPTGTVSADDYRNQAIRTWKYIVEQINTTQPTGANAVLMVTNSTTLDMAYSLVLIDASNADVMLSLPNNLDSGTPITIKRIDGSTNNVVITALNIDGNSYISLDAQNQSVRLIFYSGVWYIA